jgi:hypothetical protein
MRLRTLRFCAFVALALATFNLPVEAAPLGGIANDLQPVTSVSGVEEAAYRRCWWHAGYQTCHWYRDYGDGYYDYDYPYYGYGPGFGLFFGGGGGHFRGGHDGHFGHHR